MVLFGFLMEFLVSKVQGRIFYQIQEMITVGFLGYDVGLTGDIECKIYTEDG
jgi:hypothetical protein